MGHIKPGSKTNRGLVLSHDKETQTSLVSHKGKRRRVATVTLRLSGERKRGLTKLAIELSAIAQRLEKIYGEEDWVADAVKYIRLVADDLKAQSNVSID